MGGHSLDFREAMHGPGVTEVSVFAFMGGAEIIVPPEMAVEVSGFAMMGGVDVTARLPGETGRQAKKRRKLERKGLQPRLAAPTED